MRNSKAPVTTVEDTITMTGPLLVKKTGPDPDHILVQAQVHVPAQALTVVDGAGVDTMENMEDTFTLIMMKVTVLNQKTCLIWIIRQ